MKHFDIHTPDRSIEPELIAAINNLTKPKGSLGRLEEIAVQAGVIQQTLTPELKKPHNIVFAADHGIAAEGVSYSAPEVTRQMVLNFLKGGAGICMFCRQHGFELKVIDCGVNADYGNVPGLVGRKIRKGTRNFLHEAAMTAGEFEKAVEIGAEAVDNALSAGCNVISFGEMGVGNTSPSSIWMHLFTGIPLDKCVGAGSGLNESGIRRKFEVLEASVKNYDGDGSAEDIIRYFGGYEMVAAVGAMLRAAEKHMIIIVDGFIMTACLLAAVQICPAVMEYCIFGHKGDESGHRLLLEYLGAKPLLDLGMRLGEGTGAVCSYPIIDSAVRMLHEMSTWQKADVTNYTNR